MRQSASGQWVRLALLSASRPAGTQIGEIKKKNSNFLTLPELLRADSSESQGLVRGVVSRRHKSSKWKRRQHRKDMGDVDWHVPIDAEGAQVPAKALTLGKLSKLSAWSTNFF
jgi:hypothetical protein